MEIYACGLNEASNLSLPAVCPRYHILGSNPCSHNNHCRTPEDPSYCPRLVTKPTFILKAQSMSIIASNRNTTILSLDGRLTILGHKPPGLDLISENGGKGWGKVLHETGDDEALLLDDEGRVSIVYDVYEHHGRPERVAKVPAQGRGVLHLVPGQVMTVVTRSEPRTVRRVGRRGGGYGDFLEWYCGTSDEGVVSVLELPDKVRDVQVGGGWSTALTEAGEVYTWPSSFAEDFNARPTAAMGSGGLKALTPAEEEEGGEEEEEEGPDMSALLSDLPSPQETTPTPPPPSPQKIPLPPTLKISRSRTTTAALTSSGLYLWRDPPSPSSPSPATKPTISSLGTPSSPQLQHFSDEHGEVLRVVDVSVGKAHIVALGADGSLWAVGKGWYGELGVGVGMFELRAGEGEEGVVYDQEEAVEFAERWVRMDTSGLLGVKIEWGSVVAGEEVTFALAREVGRKGEGEGGRNGEGRRGDE